MEFIIANWQHILYVVLFIAVLIVLIVLYKKNYISESYLNILGDYLDTIDDGESLVALLAGYAKKAVYAVEQMVKAGVISKTNEERKETAMNIVTSMATTDGIELKEHDIETVSNLIEAEVHELRIAK